MPKTLITRTGHVILNVGKDYELKAKWNTYNIRSRRSIQRIQSTDKCGAREDSFELDEGRGVAMNSELVLLFKMRKYPENISLSIAHLHTLRSRYGSNSHKSPEE